MNYTQFRGCGTALITPFRDGAVDYDAFAALVDRQVAGGVDFLLPLGTTGETPCLTDEEKIYVCMKQIFKDFESIPTKYYSEAYEQAIWFINCGQPQKQEKKNPQTVDWIKDEPLIFAAVNKFVQTK